MFRGQFQFCGIELIVFRSSDDSTEDLQPPADLLQRPDTQQEKEEKPFNDQFEEEMMSSKKPSSIPQLDGATSDLEAMLTPPTQKEKEEQKQADLDFENANRILKMINLDYKAATDFFTKKDEAKKKSEEDRKIYLKELDTLRRKLEDGLTKEYIEEMVEKNVRLLEDISSGKQPSRRHNAFHEDRNNSRQALVRTNQSHMISEEQVNTIMNRVEKTLALQSKDQQDYGFKVLLPEIVTRCYADIHNISLEEAQQKIGATLDGETVAEIVGEPAVPPPDDDRGWRRRNR